MDFLSLTDGNGRVLVRGANPKIHGDTIHDTVVKKSLIEGTIHSGTRIVPREILELENPDLPEKARIKLVPTPRAIQSNVTEETSGMVIEAASPVFDSDGKLLGVLYGGKLLNRGSEIVDKVKDIVYRGEKYHGKDVGTVTIFQDGLRIATNVTWEDGERAIGTRVSKEVYDRVVVKGLPWVGRAFVVNNWYITTYEPIRNIDGGIIGMLYVGIMEASYMDLRRRVVFTFLTIGILSIILLFFIAQIMTQSIANPVKKLLDATQKVARGDLSYRVPIETNDEIGQLADSFNRMTKELRKATENYEALTQSLELRVQQKAQELEATQARLIRSEKLSALGKFSAGIAHEINNPLTSILLNSHLVMEKTSDERLRENIRLVIDETSRCSEIVKGLLEFSRQSPPEKNPIDIHGVLKKTLRLLHSQILMQKVDVVEEFTGDAPYLMADARQMEQVFANIILNALDAMECGGTLTIQTQHLEDENSLEIKFIDTGRGIPKEEIGRVFDPFFTTKVKGGTGLGLSVSYGIIVGHGGKIGVSSEPGRGTTLWITLPFQ